MINGKCFVYSRNALDYRCSTKITRDNKRKWAVPILTSSDTVRGWEKGHGEVFKTVAANTREAIYDDDN